MDLPATACKMDQSGIGKAGIAMDEVTRDSRVLNYSNGSTRGAGLLVPETATARSLALLVLRIGFGFGLWFSGYGHLTHVDQMVQRFTSWGVPLPTLSVYISGCTEAAGGVLLLLGLGTRLIALPLVFNFCVAYLTASRSKLVQLLAGPGRWNGLADVVSDDAMPFLVASLIALAFGPGKVSLDYLIQQRVLRRQRRGDNASAGVS